MRKRKPRWMEMKKRGGKEAEAKWGDKSGDSERPHGLQLFSARCNAGNSILSIESAGGALPESEDTPLHNFLKITFKY